MTAVFGPLCILLNFRNTEGEILKISFFNDHSRYTKEKKWTRSQVNRRRTTQSSIVQDKYLRTSMKRKKRRKKKTRRIRILWFHESGKSLHLHLNGSTCPPVRFVSFGPSNRTEMCHRRTTGLFVASLAPRRVAKGRRFFKESETRLKVEEETQPP